jgi:hypothetical protein
MKCINNEKSWREFLITATNQEAGQPEFCPYQELAVVVQHYL